MPRKKGGGGSSYESDVEIFLDATTSARRGHSLRAVTGHPTRPLKAVSASNVYPSTLNTDYYQIDNFMDYDETYDLTYYGYWNTTTSIFHKSFNPYPTISSYNYMSIYAKASNPTTINTFFISHVGGDDYITTSGFVFGPLTGKWKRYDIYIDKPTGWTELLSEISFEIYGPVSTSVWIDEPLLLDLRAENDKTTWINLNLTGQTMQHSTNMVSAEIAGNYGDLVFPNQMNNRRGNIQIRTHAPQDDSGLAFIEGIKNNSGKCYLRSVGEGWPIYVDSLDVGTQDTYFGSLRNIDISFIEEMG